MKHRTATRKALRPAPEVTAPSEKLPILPKRTLATKPGSGAEAVEGALQRRVDRRGSAAENLAHPAHGGDGSALAAAVSERARAVGWLAGGSAQAAIVQRETEATVSEGVDLDPLANLASLSTAYAVGVIRRELFSSETAQAAIIRVLTYAFSSLASLSTWLNYAQLAYNALSTVASIPRGVVAAFLWGMGKLFLFFANQFYNGGRLSKLLGDVTESGLFTVLHGLDASHEGIQTFINYVNSFVPYIAKWLLGAGEEEEDAEVEPVEPSLPPPEDSGKFLKLTVATPKLAQFSDEQERTRAGLQAKASAHVTLFGQKMGGDLDIRLPFGPEWQIGINDFFESSKINLPKLSIGSIKGDSLVFSNEGLMRAEMSLNELEVADGVVTAEAIRVLYRKSDESLTFEGQGSAQLWDDKRLDGALRLTLGTDGKFREAMVKVSSSSTFAIIPEHLDLVKPGGMAAFSDKSPPELAINAGVAVKGLPGGVSAEASGGVIYADEALSGFLNNLDVDIPMGKRARLVIAIIDGNFSSEGITAKSATLDFDYDKTRSEEDEDTSASSGFFSSATDLGWLNVLGLEKLSLHKGLTDLSYQGGKFAYTDDGKSGVRKVRARVLGVTAEYDAEKNVGSVSGSIKKDLKATIVRVDFPALPGVGGYLELGGFLSLEAALEAAVARDMERSDDSVTVLALSGLASASATAGLELAIGAFAGIPYLASLRGGLFGQVAGSVAGEARAGGGVILDKTSGKINEDPENPAHASFQLAGELKASVGAQLKATVLVFEKELARAELGDWTLGRYVLTGEVTSAPDGKPVIEITQQGFTGGGPKPVKLEEKNVSAEEWIESHRLAGGKLEFGSKAATKLTKTGRDILYGNYDDEKKATLAASFRSLLKQESEQVMFREIYAELARQRSAKATDSFVWTAKVFDQAVERKKILGIDRSKSKKVISQALAAYHTTPVERFMDRINLLERILTQLDHYYKVSKSQENVKEAKQLEAQIALEKELIAKQRREFSL